ncbi:MAG: YARHG domain-containing protein [Mastigocoleus sp.]
MLLNHRYQVITTLGSGGFGETFLAEDTQMPSGRKCVVKQLKPIEHNLQIYQLVQERFQREAAILENLGGNNHQIPSLYAYFQAEEKFYLIQEYVEGNTLTQRFKKQGLFNEAQIKEILASLLPVLSYVHSMGIVHRDIKPDNIILRSQDNQPVLIDFGAVRETMGTVINSQGSPTSSIVIGTPGYMPSEQAMGRPVFASDLYSLGMSVIYLLTGKQPQELQTDPNTGEFIWGQYARNISPEIVGILNKAIAYHPRERFNSAQEMLEALQMGSVSVAPTIPFIGSRGIDSVAPTEPPSFVKSNIPKSNNTLNTLSFENESSVSLPKQSAARVTKESVPSNSTTSSTQSNGNKQILLASLVAGGLIGGSIIIGLSMNKTNPEATTNVTSGSIGQEEVKTPVSPPTNNINNSNQSKLPVDKLSGNDSSVEDKVNDNGNDNKINDYFWLSKRLATDADLANKNGLELDIMRNYIFARHGRRFNNNELQEYFEKKSWYRPKYSANEFPIELISNIEMKNIEFINKYQDRTGLRHIRI